MNIKYITLGLLTAIFVSSMSLLTSCSEELEIGKKINESSYDGVYENSAHLRDGKSNRASNVVELYKPTYTTTVKLNLSKVSTSATTAKVKIDAAYLDSYNVEHGTDFELYPQDMVAFENNGVLTINSNAKVAEVEMTIQASDDLQQGKAYAIPLIVYDYSSDISVKNETAKHCIYLVKDMRKASDTYKGEDVVKGFLFFEVNGTNPLNAFSFELENGKLLWDVVVLFAANINYDSEAGRPKIQCNSNVQYLLDNNETLLQPLRKRGVKVLLGFLGNYDITGLAQLSKQGAKDFAREVAQYCKAYNLDGVNYDDEYSNSPDLNNPALAPSSLAAAARLCYETKQAMPDKLVTVFDYKNMYGASTVDGVDASQWIDVVVPNYGPYGNIRPVGRMTKKSCAGLAMEFNEGVGVQIMTAEIANKLINDKYGWFMGFAPGTDRYTDATNTSGKTSIWPRIVGVSTLYGSALKQPTIFYKKDDPKPYTYPDDMK